MYTDSLVFDDRLVFGQEVRQFHSQEESSYDAGRESGPQWVRVRTGLNPNREAAWQGNKEVKEKKKKKGNFLPKGSHKMQNK